MRKKLDWNRRDLTMSLTGKLKSGSRNYFHGRSISCFELEELEGENSCRPYVFSMYIPGAESQPSFFAADDEQTYMSFKQAFSAIHEYEAGYRGALLQLEEGGDPAQAEDWKEYAVRLGLSGK